MEVEYLDTLESMDAHNAAIDGLFWEPNHLFIICRLYINTYELCLLNLF